MDVKVKSLVKEIKDNLKQVSSSNKDEVRVMQAMLNDKKYEVGVYGKDGKIEDYNPATDYRAMCSNVVASTTKITKAEAAQLMDKYEVTKADASTMVNVSKEFVNTYLETGRKLPFGGRKYSNYSLTRKEVPAAVRAFPKKVGVNDDGSYKYETGQKKVPAHSSLKAYAPCPTWVK